MRTFNPRNPQPAHRDLTDPRSSGTAPAPQGARPGLNDPRSTGARRRAT